ncbi:hypothetical protein LI82_04125 [Methanococcoides methylutens]|uniref:Uncharacterized protein n=1 Tax=Methanococcoides methylutens TaxID=2226 RepID=A0A099T286_METMT|nr:hypothetical protein [Methanococcoides methylutens]KGK99217.1 hypothetical protein LI82_04125 [Methanococcoides methylutens]
MKSLKTWGGISNFKYEGSVADGTTIYYGKKPGIIKVSSEQFSQLLHHFKGKSVNIGTSRDKAPKGSVGKWLQENVTKTAIASYVGAILVDEEYAAKGSKRGTIEFIIQ